VVRLFLLYPLSRPCLPLPLSRPSFPPALTLKRLPPLAYASAPPFLRAGGTLVAIGLPTAGTAVCGADPVAMIFGAWTFKGSLTGNLVDTDEVLDFVDRGLFNPVVTIRPFEEFKEAFADLVRPLTSRPLFEG
jgi:D-arabinose 1-dehydrogenase-like Zn-dependent alcohol dehydrogenase